MSAALPDEAVLRWQLNVVMRFVGAQGPVEALSLVLPVWLPAVEETQEYVFLIHQLFTARVQNPAFNNFVGEDNLFAQAHKAVVRIIGFICGNDGVFHTQKQHCYMNINGSIVGETRALQLMIYSKTVTQAHARSCINRVVCFQQ